MIKRILNIGISKTYDESLKRKIRISNLITFISLLTIGPFIPLAIVYQLTLSLYLLSFFALASISNFVLHSKKMHKTAFFSYTISGYIFFISATLTFGLASNLHFFLLVLCMISAVIFDNKLTIKMFIAFAIFSFFALKWFMYNKVGYIHLPPEMKNVEEVVGNVILLLLFIISSVFFIFFKNENMLFQKEILTQKEIIEAKNKDITDSITYARRIQRSLLPTEKYIEKQINRLKN